MLNIDFLSRILETDYPAIIESWVFPLIIGLLSLSMPLVINSIHRVEDKYKKHSIGKGVVDTCFLVWYKSAVVIAVLCALVYLAQFPRIGNWGGIMNTILDHSAITLLILASINLLFSVIGLTYFFLKFTINTHSLYRYYKGCLKNYFVKIYSLYSPKYDFAIVEKSQIDTLLAIVECALGEQNERLANEINEDFKTEISTYRNTISNAQLDQRHIIVDYPDTLKCKIRDLAASCIKDELHSTQKQVMMLLRTIFIDQSPRYGDIPKFGLSYSTLSTLFEILIKAIDNKNAEFVKYYWKEIFEYTREMFYAQAVTAPEGFMPHGILKYELTEEDKNEQDLIAKMQFMLQAYLYEKQEYDILKYTLEYRNKFSSVKCLDFLYVETALRSYINSNAANNSFNYHDNENDNKDLILANYLCFIANYNYNIAGDVPYIKYNELQIQLSPFRALEFAFGNISALPPVTINEVRISRLMSDNEYKSFLASIKQRDENEEVQFIQDTPIKNQNTNLLYRFIKSPLSFEIPVHHFVWQPSFKGIDINGIRKHTFDIVCSDSISKELMAYEDIHGELPSKGFDIAQYYLSEIDKVVASSVYKPQSSQQKTKVSAEEMLDIIKNTSALDMIHFFYIDNNAPKQLAEKLGYLYDERRNFISPKEHNLRKCIKCVLLPTKNSEVQRLKNQIWIVPAKEIPYIKFLDIEDIDNSWESIHNYGNMPFDRREEWFKAMPHYVKMTEIEQNQYPIVQLSIKSRIEITEIFNIQAKIFILQE